MSAALGRGLQIARLALARRLLTLCCYALRDPGGCAASPLVAAGPRRQAWSGALENVIAPARRAAVQSD